jgi:hypothetical protein
MMSFLFPPSTVSRPATFRQSASATFPPSSLRRITEDFAISFGTTYTFLGPIDPTTPGANGFQNLETTFKYRVFKDVEHEFVFSAGLSIELGGTGAANVGADPFNTYTPTIYFGKGLGDLPDTLSWLRPVAITGQAGYAIPGGHSITTARIDPDTGDLTFDTEFHPRVLNWGLTIQYSVPYLKSSVIDLGLPDFVNHLIPLVEATLQTPMANTLTSGTQTTGTINPGVLWVGNKFQVGVEALIPINRQSGTNVGVIGQLHSISMTSIRTASAGRCSAAPGSRRAPSQGDPMRPASLIPAIPLLLSLTAGEAAAHAFLDHAEPRVGNKVANPPREVTLWFTQKLEPAFSTLTVTGPAG